jgi:hypothetical protein
MPTALSSATETTMNIVWRDVVHAILVTEDAFAKASEVLIERLRNPVCAAGQPDTGRSPSGHRARRRDAHAYVRRAVTRTFGRFPSSR